MAHRLKGGGIREINVSADVAAGILAAMKKIPMDDHRPPPAVLEALRFTVKMEENLLKVHFSNVVKFASEQDSALMASSLK